MGKAAKAEAAQANPFLLVRPGPRERDAVTGGADLLEHYKLSKIYDHAVGLQPQNYLRGVAGAAELRRGRGCELAPLAHSHAVEGLQIKPLPRAAMQAAFTLEPGVFSVPQEVLGEPVVTTMRPDASMSLGGTKGGAGAVAGGGGGGKKKEKKAKKEKKEKKEKKRKRDGSAEAGQS